MASAFDRLVEVWAADSSGYGRAGSGWVLGDRTVLTAAHVLGSFSAQTGTLEVRLANLGEDPRWYASEVAYRSDRDHDVSEDSLDIALLEIIDSAWKPPKSRPPRLARLGSRAEEVEAIGFPESEVRADGLRIPEHAKGVLYPGGGVRRHQVPFEVSDSVPATSPLWQGMSGAAVRDLHGRTVGVIKAIAPNREHRRLFVSQIASAFADEKFTAQARRLLGHAVVEVAEAPTWRSHLAVLTPAGSPPMVCAADPAELGIKQARLVAQDGESPLGYVLRAVDDSIAAAIDRGLDASQRGETVGRMILVTGDSGAGKSRAALEAIRRAGTLRNRPLVVPRFGPPLSKLVDDAFDGVIDLRDSVIWLDDVNRFFDAASLDRATLIRLLSEQQGLIVLATINQHALQVLEPQGDFRTQGWDLIGDRETVTRIAVDRHWRPEERVHALEVIRETDLREAIGRGIGIPEWLIAGPDLVNKMETATYERRTLAWTLVDWYRTGRTDQLAVDQVRSLWESDLLAAGYDADELTTTFSETLRWSKEKVLRQALVSEDAGMLTIHDYILGHVARTQADRPIAARMWSLALDRVEALPNPEGTYYAIGLAAFNLGEAEVGVQAMLPLTSLEGMAARFNLGLLLLRANRPDLIVEALKNNSPDLHAQGGTSSGTDSEEDQDPWLAATRGALQVAWLLEQVGETDSAIKDYRTVASHGHPKASHYGPLSIGVLRVNADDLPAAEAEYALATAMGEWVVHTGAARYLRGRIAESEGDIAAATSAYRDAIAPEQRHPWIAEAAMKLAVILGENDDIDGTIAAFRRAAEAGSGRLSAFAYVLLGRRLIDTGDIVGARDAFERAISSGSGYVAPASAGLGRILFDDQQYERAAELFQRAIDVGEDHKNFNAEATFYLGMCRVYNKDAIGAKEALRRAMTMDDLLWGPYAALNLAHLLEADGDIAGARAVYEEVTSSSSAEAGATARQQLARLDSS